MPAYACCTIFFETPVAELTEVYEEVAEPANGYLTRMDDSWMLVDATATETANWARQRDLAILLSNEESIALSLFLVGEHWALALAIGGQPGPMAVFTPDDPDALDTLPIELMRLEKALGTLFPGEANVDEIDRLFGALLDGFVGIEEVMSEILRMLGCAPDWLRWSWFETIPQQLFLDPDLASRVLPLGEARAFWEE